jgi:hypothetical protein
MGTRKSLLKTAFNLSNPRAKLRDERSRAFTRVGSLALPLKQTSLDRPNYLFGYSSVRVDEANQAAKTQAR